MNPPPDQDDYFVDRQKSPKDKPKKAEEEISYPFSDICPIHGHHLIGECEGRPQPHLDPSQVNGSAMFFAGLLFLAAGILLASSSHKTEETPKAQTPAVKKEVMTLVR